MPGPLHDDASDDDAMISLGGEPEDFPMGDVDPDKLQVCEYWRCGDLFEQRTANQRFCRKACRSRHHKWTRAQLRKQRKADAKAERQRLRNLGN